jgi:hypothetical protein
MFQRMTNGSGNIGERDIPALLLMMTRWQKRLGILPIGKL